VAAQTKPVLRVRVRQQQPNVLLHRQPVPVLRASSGARVRGGDSSGLGDGVCALARRQVHEEGAARAADQAQFYSAGGGAATPARAAGRLALAGAKRLYGLRMTPERSRNGCRRSIRLNLKSVELIALVVLLSLLSARQWHIHTNLLEIPDAWRFSHVPTYLSAANPQMPILIQRHIFYGKGHG